MNNYFFIGVKRNESDEVSKFIEESTIGTIENVIRKEKLQARENNPVKELGNIFWFFL